MNAASLFGGGAIRKEFPKALRIVLAVIFVLIGLGLTIYAARQLAGGFKSKISEQMSAQGLSAERASAELSGAQKFGGVVLLKGPGTIVCDGEKLTIIHEGAPSLATGGAGDLLTGIIVSLLGQGLSPEKAAIVGAALHGRAGYIEGMKRGMIGTLPMDLCQNIRELINVKD